MKKLILLLAGTFSLFSTDAQYIRNTSSVLTGSPKKTSSFNSHCSNTVSRPSGRHSGARTTSVAFLTETFGSGTATSLPTGWTTGAITVGTWKWANTPSTSAFTIGAIASTTASDGWMIFNSDSIGAATGGAPASWLQSPAYN